MRPFWARIGHFGIDGRREGVRGRLLVRREDVRVGRTVSVAVVASCIVRSFWLGLCPPLRFASLCKT